MGEDNGKPVPLKPGSCTIHANYTPHYSRGNTTDRLRRAFVVQLRPAKMIKEARIRGFDHGRFKANDGAQRTERPAMATASANA
eukprot:NODE_6235_length_463_cov_190.971014_g4724_i0.p2 GENE.NODE_6235_length_463_cov_190.971014_g4724_i0~~NODE_6235_length_463_cov_190.971014_g4724_i0.p2  ORF type:complete len:94 (-),score=40.37 NODE_6235_length_463_cov_190.971014_g4724_i0:180-431(-)